MRRHTVPSVMTLSISAASILNSLGSLNREEILMTDTNEYDPPEVSTGDTAYLAAKDILSLLPGASALFEYFIKSPLEKRREGWMKMAAEALRDLEESRFDIEKLRADERFITIVLQATTVALRNHQKEKLLALRNAVINSAKDADFNEDILAT